MVNTRANLGKAVYWTRLTARLSSLITCSVFLLIALLEVTNEDRPQAPAILVLTFLTLTILACLAAWRWEQVGGSLVLIGALSLGLAAYSSASIIGPGDFAFLASLIYSLPFAVVGALFLLTGQIAQNHRGP